jgi:hypothetical protein
MVRPLEREVRERTVSAPEARDPELGVRSGEALSVTMIVSSSSFGGVDFATARRAMALFAREVMPKFPPAPSPSTSRFPPRTLWGYVACPAPEDRTGAPIFNSSPATGSNIVKSARARLQSGPPRRAC